jgi:hypothetical protein
MGERYRGIVFEWVQRHQPVNGEFLIKETLNRFSCRHAVAKRHPVNNCFDWIPAFAGMTKGWDGGVIFTIQPPPCPPPSRGRE